MIATAIIVNVLILIALSIELINARKDIRAMRTRLDELSKRHAALSDRVAGKARAAQKHKLTNLSRLH